MNSESRGAALVVELEGDDETDDDVESRGQEKRARMTRSHSSARSIAQRRRCVQVSVKALME